MNYKRFIELSAYFLLIFVAVANHRIEQWLGCSVLFSIFEFKLDPRVGNDVAKVGLFVFIGLKHAHYQVFQFGGQLGFESESEKASID